MNKLIFLIGLPGSGKSTFAKNTFNASHQVVISSDELREEIFGNVDCQKDNNRVFTELYDRARHNLKNGKDVIIDATNLTSAKRRYGIEIIARDMEDVLIQALLILCPYNECLNRNKQRERSVPINVIKRMYKNFEMPVYAEGFDVIDYRFTGQLFEHERVQYIESVFGLKQYNPHHTKTIGEHCFAVATIVEKYEDMDLTLAACLHDFGKKFCMSFEDSQGRLSHSAHFYNHENVGSDDSFFYGEGLKYDKIRTAQLICYHMLPHYCKTEKSINRKIKMLGKELWNDILKLYEADMLVK